MTPTQQDVERAKEIAHGHGVIPFKELTAKFAQALADERERTWRKVLETAREQPLLGQTTNGWNLCRKAIIQSALSEGVVIE